MFTSGGLFFACISLFLGFKFLNCKGKSLTKKSNLFKSPYFSFIGNLGNSNLSLLKSITPECWPNAYLNIFLIYVLCSRLYSPNG